MCLLLLSVVVCVLFVWYLLCADRCLLLVVCWLLCVDCSLFVGCGVLLLLVVCRLANVVC